MVPVGFLHHNMHWTKLLQISVYARHAQICIQSLGWTVGPEGIHAAKRVPDP